MSSFRGTLDQAKALLELAGQVFPSEGRCLGTWIGRGVGVATVLEAALELDGLGGGAETEEGDEHSDTNRIH